MEKKAAVIGAGMMGHGIAQVIAQGGYEVALTDTDRGTLALAPKRIARNLELLVEQGFLSAQAARAVLPRVHLCDSVEEAVEGADFVLEAVTENLDLKQRIFVRLDQLCPAPAILTSNSSSFRITEIAARVTRPERTIGSHFYMPAYVIPLVEVVRGEQTDDATAQRTRAFWQELGKAPVVVNKDIPGFLANRLQSALSREAISLFQKGIASAEDIDKAVRLGFGLRLPVTGPLEQRDLAGVDLTLAVSASIYPDLENSADPLPIIREKVMRGEIGLKAGKGFYDWTGKDPGQVIRRKDERLLRLVKFLAEQEKE